MSQSESEIQARLLAQALPFMQRYENKTIVVKYGGHAMGNPELGKAFASDIGLLKRNIESLEFRSEGFQEQLKAVREQRALLNEEYAGKKVLLAKDLIRKTELLQARSTSA